MNFKTLILATAVAAALSACSTVNKIIPTSKGTAGETGTEYATGTVKTDKIKTDKKGKNTGVTVDKPAKALVNAPSVADLCSGQWVITDVKSTQIHGEDDAPYIAFDRTGRFYAFDGCNYLNGYYVLRADGVLALSNVLSTRRMCNEDYSYIIDGILADDARLTLDSKRIGQETYIYAKNQAGKTQLVLRRHNMEFLNGNWQVTAIDGNPVAEDDMTVFFDIPELKLHGNTGCNFVNGTLYIDPNRSNALDISNMGITRMGCPKVAQETAMLVALENTASAIAGHNLETVMLLDKNGKELLTLKKLATNPN